MEWRFRRGNKDERERKKDGGEKRREEGIQEILPLVISQYETRLTAAKVSAAELALFHTGAILSSLGYRPPARHLGST